MAKWFLLMGAVTLALTVCYGEIDCWDYLVSGPQGVPDSAFSASTYHEYTVHTHRPACGRLYMDRDLNSTGCPAPTKGGWCSTFEDPEPYIQVEFADLKKIVGIEVQGVNYPSTAGNDIRTYQVLFSQNGDDWEYVESEGVTQTFYSPTNSTKPYSNVTPPVVARYVRIRILTWISPSLTAPCLRFDVIGCSYDTGKRRFAYLPLPAGSMSDNDVISTSIARHLGECSLWCHRDVTCRSFSYSNAYKECKAYRVNKYNQLKSGVGNQSTWEKQYLYYFDMANVGLYMTTVPSTGLIYKVITRRYSTQDAMTACADLEMKLLVVNSVDKLNLVQRVTSSSIILRK